MAFPGAVAAPLIDVTNLANWATVGATIVAAVGVIVAAITLIATLVSQTQLARFAATSENIWRFDDQWHTDEFRALRLEAVRALNRGGEVPECIDVWNFFEMLGVMCHKKAVDLDVVASKFADKCIGYWYLSADLIRARRETHPLLWVEFEWLAKSVQQVQLKAEQQIELKARRPSRRLLDAFRAPEVLAQKPNAEWLKEFVEGESNLLPSAAITAETDPHIQTEHESDPKMA